MTDNPSPRQGEDHPDWIGVIVLAAQAALLTLLVWLAVLGIVASAWACLWLIRSMGTPA